MIRVTFIRDDSYFYINLLALVTLWALQQAWVSIELVENVKFMTC